MAKRVKKTVLSGITREQADAAFAEFAIADAKEQKLTATMDEQLTKIREKYQDQLQECAEKKEQAFDLMQAYATENKDQIFTKKRSIETSHGVFGFRLGTPKLKTAKGFTWPAVTQMLKEFLPGFVRTTEEAAKNLLLDARDDEEVAKLFSKCGIYVDQDESFFVECKKEEALS